MNRKNYDAMVAQNFEDRNKSSDAAPRALATGGHDPASIAAKMASLKFAKKRNSTSEDVNKDPDWFKKVGSAVRGEIKEKSPEKQERESSIARIKALGKISEEDERKIQAEMAVMFKEKQEELVP